MISVKNGDQACSNGGISQVIPRSVKFGHRPIPRAMALTTSNCFVSTATPKSHHPVTSATPRLAVFSKRDGGPFQSFRVGKRSAGDGSAEAQTEMSFSLDVKSLVPAVGSASSAFLFPNSRRKDPNTVFVAGATGQAGIRIAQALLRQGFSVRAGVPELEAAQELARLASTYRMISKEETKRLNAVESSFEDASSMAKAIGNASKVVVTVGPSENGPAAEVNASNALRVVEAACLASVGHVAIVCDRSATTSTYNVLDGITSFFGNLFSRSQPLSVPELLQEVAAAGISYTVIKTGLTDDFSPESSYNVVVAAEGNIGAANDYKVPTSRIASVVADLFSNTTAAENKVVEIFTNPSAPARSVDELFSAIPEDGRRRAYAESLAKAEAEKEAVIATERARKATEAARRLKEEVKRLSEQEAKAASLTEKAQEKAAVAGSSVLGAKGDDVNYSTKTQEDKRDAVGASMESLWSRAKDFSSKLSNISSQLPIIDEKPTSEKPKVQMATVRGQAKARALPGRNAVFKKPTLEFPKLPGLKPRDELKSKNKQPESEEKINIFGGLFKQETIYIDDD